MRLSKTTRKFLAVWCCDGLETLCDLTELERQQNDWEKKHPGASSRENNIATNLRARAYSRYWCEPGSIVSASMRFISSILKA